MSVSDKTPAEQAADAAWRDECDEARDDTARRSERPDSLARVIRDLKAEARDNAGAKGFDGFAMSLRDYAQRLERLTAAPAIAKREKAS